MIDGDTLFIECFKPDYHGKYRFFISEQETFEDKVDFNEYALLKYNKFTVTQKHIDKITKKGITDSEGYPYKISFDDLHHTINALNDIQSFLLNNANDVFDTFFELEHLTVKKPIYFETDNIIYALRDENTEFSYIADIDLRIDRKFNINADLYVICKKGVYGKSKPKKYEYLKVRIPDYINSSLYEFNDKIAKIPQLFNKNIDLSEHENCETVDFLTLTDLKNYNRDRFYGKITRWNELIVDKHSRKLISYVQLYPYLKLCIDETNMYKILNIQNTIKHKYDIHVNTQHIINLIDKMKG